MKKWPHPRSHQSPWDSHQVWDLGCTQEKIQEHAILKQKKANSARKHTPETECRPFGKSREAIGYGVVSFYRGE